LSIKPSQYSEKFSGVLTILLFGPLPPPFGGATVSFKYLIDALAEREDVHLLVVDSSRGGRGGFIKNLYRALRAIVKASYLIRRADVVALHASSSSLYRVGPIIYWLTCLWKRPLIIRQFGGTSHQSYKHLRGRIMRWLIRRCDLYLVQTKALLKIIREDGITHAEWFRTCRPFPQDCEGQTRTNRFCRRFVYLGHVRPLKGIKYIIDAAERFEKDITIDIYGPFMEGLSEKTFARCKNVRYRGIVQPEDVQKILSRYDAMLLPTCFKSEGYPGCIIEAYFAGLPIICTRVGALPEIVDESNGILIEPHNSDALYEAMTALVEDDQLWNKLRRGSLAKR